MRDVKQTGGNLAEEFLGIDGIGEFPEWPSSEQPSAAAQLRTARVQLVRRLKTILGQLHEDDIHQENFDKAFRDLMTSVQAHARREEAVIRRSSAA